jgi:putative transposase
MKINAMQIIYKSRKKLDQRFKNRIGSGRFMVTMVCCKRKPVFGKIHNQKMVLSEIGELIYEVWKRNEIIFPQIKLGEFILMPDHMHGIVNILDVEGVEKICLARIIHSFKSASGKAYVRHCTSQGSRARYPLWQRGYNEKWIPDDRAYSAMTRYIRLNPIRGSGKRRSAGRGPAAS